MSCKKNWDLITPQELASSLILADDKKRLVIDIRSFLEFNTCHIRGAVNVSFSKMIKRSLQNHQLPIKQLLALSYNQLNFDLDYNIVVYDQSTSQPEMLSEDCFLIVIMEKLVSEFNNVRFLIGGLLNFQAEFHSLCETQRRSLSSASSFSCPRQKCMLSLSQPCMSTSGPTKILPFLFLGSQQDALSQEVMKQNGISYVLNVSTNGDEPNFLSDGHFLRIPINDSHSDKLLPYFSTAFQFIDKVREANGCVLVHCLAGISRSPTLAIAYLMQYLGLTCDEAYKYVKDKRPTISPNFNFLGQLLEFEKTLRLKSGSDILTSTFKTEMVSREKVLQISFSTNNVKPYDCEGSVLPYENLNQGSSSMVIAEDETKQEIFENKHPLKSFCKEDVTCNSTNVAGGETCSSPLVRTLPSRPSTLSSLNKNLPKLNFMVSSATLPKVKPSPILEVPSPEESLKYKNACLNDCFKQQKILDVGHLSASSHSDDSSSHSKMSNVTKISQECAPTTLLTSDRDELSHIKNAGSIHHFQSSRKFHSPQNVYNSPRQRGVAQHYSQQSQRLKSHQQQKLNRRFHHFPRTHMDHSHNYYLPSFHQHLYGFPTPKAAIFPYKFSRGASRQCFPQFHSTQLPNLYLNHPCCQPGNVYFSDFFNYFNGHRYHGNINAQHYLNNPCGSHFQRHSFYTSNIGNSFYQFPPAGNFIFQEDSCNVLGKSFLHNNSYYRADALHPYFANAYYETKTANVRTDKNNSQSNGFSFSQKFCNHPSSCRNLRSSSSTFTPPALSRTSNNSSFYRKSENAQLENSAIYRTEVSNFPDNAALNSPSTEPDLDHFLPSLVSVSKSLSVSSTGNDRLLYSSEKAPLQLRPNSIAFKSIKLGLVVVNSLESNCSKSSEVPFSAMSGGGVCDDALPSDDFDVSNHEFKKAGDLFPIENYEKNESREDELLNLTGLDFKSNDDGRAIVLRSAVPSQAHSLSDENEIYMSSEVSSNDQSFPFHNFFRKATCSSISSSSSSSSRKSRSLEDVHFFSRAHILSKTTCGHFKKLYRSLSSENYPCGEKRKLSLSAYVSDNYSENDINSANQFKFVDVLTASHKWQSNEEKVETGEMPSAASSQNSLRNNVEIVKVS